MHIFQTIAQEHGIESVSIDPNFKIGARSKKVGFSPKNRARQTNANQGSTLGEIANTYNEKNQMNNKHANAPFP